MFELANTDPNDKQLLRKQMMLVWRAQKTVMLRLAGYRLCFARILFKFGCLLLSLFKMIIGGRMCLERRPYALMSLMICSAVSLTSASLLAIVNLHQLGRAESFESPGSGPFSITHKRPTAPLIQQLDEQEVLRIGQCFEGKLFPECSLTAMKYEAEYGHSSMGSFGGSPDILRNLFDNLLPYMRAQIESCARQIYLDQYYSSHTTVELLKVGAL